MTTAAHQLPCSLTYPIQRLSKQRAISMSRSGETHAKYRRIGIRNMSTHQRTLSLVGVLELSLVVLNGCAMMHVDEGQLRVGDSLNIYAPFDNSRDWGPSYLVGAPGHHLGMGARIDDDRTYLSDAGPGS